MAFWRAMPAPTPDARCLRELAGKYRALAVLRAKRDSYGFVADRAALRGLAERYPGCLRELDTLDGAELARRANEADAAAAGAPHAPWLTWIWAYHRLMRAALGAKGALRSGPAPGHGEIERLAAEATRTAGWPIDATFIRALIRPAQGRIGVVVLEHLGATFTVPARVIAEALFPVRRPSPYKLR